MVPQVTNVQPARSHGEQAYVVENSKPSTVYHRWLSRPPACEVSRRLFV